MMDLHIDLALQKISKSLAVIDLERINNMTQIKLINFVNMPFHLEIMLWQMILRNGKS